MPGTRTREICLQTETPNVTCIKSSLYVHTLTQWLHNGMPSADLNERLIRLVDLSEIQALEEPTEKPPTVQADPSLE